MPVTVKIPFQPLLSTFHGLGKKKKANLMSNFLCRCAELQKVQRNNPPLISTLFKSVPLGFFCLFVFSPYGNFYFKLAYFICPFIDSLVLVTLFHLLLSHNQHERKIQMEYN